VSAWSKGNAQPSRHRSTSEPKACSKGDRQPRQSRRATLPSSQPKDSLCHQCRRKAARHRDLDTTVECCWRNQRASRSRVHTWIASESTRAHRV
jgi:hypothetical protein